MLVINLIISWKVVFSQMVIARNEVQRLGEKHLKLGFLVTNADMMEILFCVSVLSEKNLF